VTGRRHEAPGFVNNLCKSSQRSTAGAQKCLTMLEKKGSQAFFCGLERFYGGVDKGEISKNLLTGRRVCGRFRGA
jgi:hypothetical protein